MRIFNKKNFWALCCSILLLWASPLRANGDFVVKEIKISGLQRLSQGTVLNYLPIQVGEELQSKDSGKLIRALYETGFFQSIALSRSGHTLIVKVVERPTIGSLVFSGNKEVPTDKLKDLLKELGLVKGQIFQRASLEHLEKELKQAYNERGKYNTWVQTKVTPLDENRVAIQILISEGRVARIKEIRIIGNHAYSTATLRKHLSLSSKSVWTYFNKQDQYSKASMDASLEALRSYYLDRGYLKFQVLSSQVMLSPDKKDVFISVHIEEGPQYHFSGYDILGKSILSKEQISTLIQIKPGQVFSRKKVTESISRIGMALSNKGFGFPAVNAEPMIDEKNKTVFIHFMIEPGRVVYVRRINFHGNTNTADYVLRHVMLQDEGDRLCLHRIKESERRIRTLGYLKNIQIKTTPVVGTNNQVDLDVEVEEVPSAEATASVGYGTTGPQVSAGFNQHNFMGTGRSLGFNFNASYWGQDYSANYYNPFYTRSGIGRGINAYFQKVNPKHLDVSSYSSDRFGLDFNYSVPLNPQSQMQFGYGYQNLDIRSIGSVQQIQNFAAIAGSHFQELRFTLGLNRNSYDQFPYPKRGINQQAGVLLALPAADHSLSYYKASYQAHWYQPITRGFIFSLLGNVAYGNGWKGLGLPFFENYFAGGVVQPGQVRGYESYGLGPQDSRGNALGGNLLLNGSAGIILPYPLSRDSIRTTIFVDAGNVFSQNLPLAFAGVNEGPIRYSAGVSLEWRSPYGPLSFNLAKALNNQPWDQTQWFQFSLSSSF